MFRSRWVCSVLLGVVLAAGCVRTARTAATLAVDEAINAVVSELGSEVDTAINAAEQRLRVTTSSVSREISRVARIGFGVSLGKLELELDRAATRLATAVSDELEGIMMTALERGAGAWSATVDDQSTKIIAGIRRAASTRIEAELSAIDVSLSVDRELARATARTIAVNTAKPQLEVMLADAKAKRDGCHFERSGDVACEADYQARVFDATGWFMAKLETAGSEGSIEKTLHASRAAAEKDARDRAKAWVDNETANLDAHTRDLRARGITRFNGLAEELRASVRASGDRLATELRERLRATNAASLALMTEEDINRLVASVLDGTLVRLAEQIKSRLRTELKRVAYAAIDRVLD